MKIKLLFLLALLSLISCSKEEFGIPDVREQKRAPSLSFSTSQLCSLSTVVKPKVDFLFVWDNSSSSFFINDNTRRALRQTINSMADSFDYRIILAPLLDNDAGTNNRTVFVMAENANGLGSASQYLVPSDETARINQFRFLNAGQGGSLEEGFDRSLYLLNLFENNVIRNDSYVFVILMSNGDDNGFQTTGFPTGAAASQHFTDRFRQFDAFKTRKRSLQMRFISIVAHSNCRFGFRTGNRYRDMSEALYSNHSPALFDQTGRVTPDSYDVCGADFTNLFRGPNESIQRVQIGHQYNFWPITNTTSNFDPGAIRVRKNSGQVLTQGIDFQYVPSENPYTNQNTRFSPTAGEPFTGYMIRLMNDGILSFPECLTVTTQTPADFFGFIALPKEPRLDTVTLQVNNRSIPRSTTNGWEYIGFQNDQNIKVRSRQEPNIGGTPPTNKTGYFLKLNGDAIYTNSDEIEFRYTPVSNNK